ncbi:MULTISPECIES: magnesium transporter CorA family protein [spotted fever group]|uniref:Magnesium transport protein CorA n=1 Tax=Rickettsia tamurae subsp. buchneri TaxID=1462938 RepID=A0A8E1BZX5_9RICK|nr:MULTISPECIES: magnesium transporter CorA family protein [spotted fever group]EER22524.1 magnesium and cobalt transport protein CorA [Rickettsia endosymbiont of Ixodes scapularis]KDO02813.1 Magnesium transport protein CorA [Rickettsia tamurae subsp. buchneri]
MITTYLKENSSIVKNEEYIINESTLWIDLFNITDEEKVIVKNTLNIEIPTLKDISQIEISERLYVENEVLYLTITELVNKEQEFPETHSIVFILHKGCLITVRYVELIPFNDCINKFAKQLNNKHNAENILFMLLRNMVTRLSNIVQLISMDIDDYGCLILDNNINDLRIDHTNVLKKISRKGDLLSKSRECLFSLTMAIQYILKSPQITQNKASKDLLDTLLRDVDSIINFSQFISSEIARTLDAALGMIAIEQNNIIKIFSLVTIFFLPPTLIASIYGMNFTVMPELKSPYGYPIALFLMLLSTIITYKYFKKRKWL